MTPKNTYIVTIFPTNSHSDKFFILCCHHTTLHKTIFIASPRFECVQKNLLVYKFWHQTKFFSDGGGGGGN
ncbi:unnamed protein product [Meloidogyne enterolobii]|uniref:Uncharacterized protein n=1 Tax=Meloidogyne enterolobii TaxID=390850 RepID=A0ACB1AU02_MELEN